MNFKKPKFWDYNYKNFIAILLYPLSLITFLINYFKIDYQYNYQKIKTICIGNIYIGGTGKTPLALKINYLLKSKYKIAFIKKKYSDQIEINFKQFDKINLSHIDMVALKPFAPYSHPVPPFPILTIDHNIDYGKEISLSIQ